MADSLTRTDETTHREVVMTFETQASLATIDTQLALAAEYWYRGSGDFDSLTNGEKRDVLLSEIRRYVRHAVREQLKRDAAEAAATSTAFD